MSDERQRAEEAARQLMEEIVDHVCQRSPDTGSSRRPHPINEHWLAHKLKDALLAFHGGRVERLEAALRPFVAQFEHARVRRGDAAADWFEKMPGEWPFDIKTTMAHMRKARAALDGGKEGV